MANKTQVLTTMTTRQKVIAGVTVIVVLVLVWQIIGLFGGGGSAPTPPPVASAPKTSATGGTGPGVNANKAPQPAQLVKATPAMTARETQLMKMQEETQAKYLAGINQLQMLKLAKDIAEANQAIVTAQLATVTSQKKIVDLLSVPADIKPYGTSLVSPTPVVAGAPAAPIPTPAPVTSMPVTTSQPQVFYTVISVSQLQYKWNAVLGYKGSLYSVSVGDVLPADGSKVVRIDRRGVILEKAGVRSRVSLVPII